MLRLVEPRLRILPQLVELLLRVRVTVTVRVPVRVKARVRVRRLRGLGLGLAAVAACKALRVGFTTPLGFKSEPIAATVSTALITPSEMAAASRSTFGSTFDCFSSSGDAAMSQAARWDAAPAHWQRGCGTKAEAARHASMCERAGRGGRAGCRGPAKILSFWLVGGNPADSWRHIFPPYSTSEPVICSPLEVAPLRATQVPRLPARRLGPRRALPAHG